jgi:hypothetical protein
MIDQCADIEGHVGMLRD